MALAIHGAKVLSEHVIRYVEDKSHDRDQLEQDYTSAWNSLFSRRLWAGRQIQQLFGGIWSPKPGRLCWPTARQALLAI